MKGISCPDVVFPELVAAVLAGVEEGALGEMRGQRRVQQI